MAQGKRTVAVIGFVIATLATFDTAHAEIRWNRSPEETLSAARQSGKPILVFVSAKWCHYCTKMKQDTWSDKRVDAAVAEHFETLVLDGDRDRQIVSKMELDGFPATLVYTPDGQYISQKGGYMPPEQTLTWLASMKR